jgi:superfamily II DNA or RNA helicase
MILWQDKYNIFSKFDTFVDGDTFKAIRSILNDSGFVYDKKTKISKSNVFSIEKDLIQRLELFDSVHIHLGNLTIKATDYIKTYRIPYDETLLPVPPKNRIQKCAINGAVKLEGSLHIHRMGVGKTYIAVGAWNHFYHYGVVNQMVIVTVGIVLYNWKYEILKFANDVTEDDIYVVTSKNRKPFDKEYKYIIMTYDGLKMLMRDMKKIKKIDKLDATMKDRKFMLVADEIHSISNKGTVQNKVIHKLSAYASIKMGLSATPIRRVWQEKYQHMKFLSKDLVFGMNYQQFVKSTATTRGAYSSIVKVSKPEKQEVWDNFWEPLIFTGQLNIEAQNHIKVIWIEMDDIYEQMYKDMAQRKIEDIIAKEGYLDATKTLGMFTHMIMALADFSLVEHVMDGLEEWDIKRNPKYDIVKQLLTTHIEENKEKVVLWQDNPKLLNKLGQEFHKYNPYVMHGKSGYDKKERNIIVSDFNTNSKRPLLIGNKQVLGTGGNIQGANVSIFWNTDHDFIKFDQATGRIYREGQDKDCIQYVILFKNSIEESAWWTIQNKANLNSLTLKFKSFNKQQIKDILTGNIDKVFGDVI